jgi:N,N'-diacetyllegionaminate synthase
MLNKTVRIGSRKIGAGSPVFIIAEAGVNHFGNIEIAKHLIDMAVIARADAVKFQIYKTENLIASTVPEWPHWRDRLKPKELPYTAFEELKEYCQRKGILFFATAHDDESLDFLKTLEPPAYKIGSGEVSNPAYMRKVARMGQPIILSTGMYAMADVRETVDIFIGEGCRDLVLLHCITSYPPLPEDINLKVMASLRREFGCPVGYSDHTVGNDMVLAAVALGASVVEKHIAVSKNAPNSQDCPVSCDEHDLIELVNGARKIEKALGSGVKAPSERELKSLDWARKSVVARVEIKKGQRITKDMLIIKRPGTGISPRDLSGVVGKTARKDIRRDTLLDFEDLK